MITLDSSSAWQSARRMVAANRDVLVAIAGVFFLLPGLIGAVVLPTPDVNGKMDQQALADAVLQFYVHAGPVLVALTLPMLVGYLTLLAMLLDRDRPTVATAIMTGIRLLPSYLAAQLLISLGLSVLWATALSVLSLAMPQVAAALLSLVAMIYPLVRVLLVGPEMIAQRLRNPIRAIIGGLARTRGHTLGMLLFFGPAMTLFLVVYGVVMIVVSLAVFNLAQAEVQRLISEAAGAVLLAVGYTYYAAMTASTYDQLGPINGADEAVSPPAPR